MQPASSSLILAPVSSSANGSLIHSMNQISQQHARIFVSFLKCKMPFRNYFHSSITSILWTLSNVGSLQHHLGMQSHIRLNGMECKSKGQCSLLSNTGTLDEFFWWVTFQALVSRAIYFLKLFLRLILNVCIMNLPFNKFILKSKV